MKSVCGSKLWKILFGLWFIGLYSGGGGVDSLVEASRSLAGTETGAEAYVTLLYGDEFVLGVRVLGKSIRDTGSTKDMVVLVSDGVSDYAQKLLQADGWIVEKISLLANPNQVRPTRFWGVYTKLKIFNMTKYKKVVYLDADTIVVKNVEALFKCGRFCANLKHSERLNSGVMVVEPSESVFNDMMSKVSTLPSYTGGDQGFLNSYYTGFASAPVFEPDLPLEVLNSRPVPEMERLSTLYNADVGLYMLANKWMVDENQLRVIHYTLGPLKPWDWWTFWLVKPVDAWQNIRVKLEGSLPGADGGENPNDALVVKFLFLFPLGLLLFCYYRSYLKASKTMYCSCYLIVTVLKFFHLYIQTRSIFDHVRLVYYKFRTGGVLPYSSVASSTLSSNQQFSGNNIHSKVPVFLEGVSVLSCLVAGVTALGLSLLIIPRQVTPWTGLLLMYEWTFTIFFLLFGSYIHFIYLWGKTAANRGGPVSSSDYDSRKGHQRQSSCDVAAWWYGLGMVFLAIAAPSLPSILGITAIFARLGLMVVGGLLLVSFMTYTSQHLAVRSFVRGFEEKDLQRPTSLCFLC